MTTNIDIRLMNDILINLLKLEKKQYKEYKPSINRYSWNQIVNGIINICDQYSLSINIAFLAIALFEKSIRTTDDHILVALMCIIIAIKLDGTDENEKPNVNLLILLARRIKNYTWKFENKYIAPFDIYDYEQLIIDRLNYDILLVTPISFSNIYINLLFDDEILINQIITQLNYLITLIRALSITKRYKPSIICLGALYYLYTRQPDIIAYYNKNPQKNIIEKLPGFNIEYITEIVSIITDIDKEITFDHNLYNHGSYINISN